MKKIAAILETLSTSQESYYLIKAFNKIKENTDYSPMCFYSTLSASPITPFFACMNISYYAKFDGVAIATSIDCANMMIKTKNNAKKFLYLWDLEWLRKPMDFNYVSSIVRNPELNIITRSYSHKELFENYSNKKVAGVVDDWDMEKMEKILWT